MSGPKEMKEVNPSLRSSPARVGKPSRPSFWSARRLRLSCSVSTPRAPSSRANLGASLCSPPAHLSSRAAPDGASLAPLWRRLSSSANEEESPSESEGLSSSLPSVAAHRTEGRPVRRTARSYEEARATTASRRGADATTRDEDARRAATTRARAPRRATGAETNEIDMGAARCSNDAPRGAGPTLVLSVPTGEASRRPRLGSNSPFGKLRPSPHLAPHSDARGDDSTDADEGGMDTIQQIKNARMNAEAHARGRAKGAGSSNMTVQQHAAALQAMSNGHAVPYPATLRVVVHEGDRAPQGEAKEEKKAPGFVRNESGGFFTS